jgi:hypothetical protein
MATPISRGFVPPDVGSVKTVVIAGVAEMVPKSSLWFAGPFGIFMLAICH